MIKMVCLGDSITEGKDIEKGFRWASLAANALGLEILNCGIGNGKSGADDFAGHNERPVKRVYPE